MLLGLSFSADGRVLTASGTVAGKGDDLAAVERGWEVVSGRERFVRRSQLSAPGLGRVGDDGRLGMIRGMDEASYVQHHAPDGRYSARAGALTIKLYDAAGKEVRAFGGDGVLGHTAAFSPDGTLLAAGRTDGRVRLWRVA